MKRLWPLLCIIFGSVLDVSSQRYNSSDFEEVASCRCGTTSFSSNDVRGEIKSPRHPENYCDDLSCTWIIKAGKPDTGIRLHFETFDTENLADYLDVFYIEDNIVQKLQRLTGDIDGPDLPSFVISDGGLELNFRTDGSVIQSGFFATFTRFNITDQQCVCPSVLYEASSRSTVITSPNYPRPYCHNIHCFYFIEAPAPFSVELTVDDLELEGRYDSLLVFDGNDTTSSSRSLMKKFTGHMNGTTKLVSYTQKMTVIFRADADTSHKGFRARFRKIKGPCTCPPRASFRGQGGNFSSPGFPKSYCANLNCTYRLHAPRNKVIQIEFTTFDMFYGDTVSVASSGGGFEYPLVKYSASQAPFKFTSDRNDVRMRLVTSDHISSEIVGFNATWKAMSRSRSCYCPLPNPKNMTQQEGTLTMTACGPLDCQWLLNPPDETSKAMSIWVDNIQLEQRHCWLRIVNGAFHRNFSAPNIIRQYTGRSMNNSEVSVSRSSSSTSPTNRPVTIHFHTEMAAANVAHSGFTLRYKWHIQNCDCGQLTYTASSRHQNLSSPGYPAPYCDDLRCTYRISASEGNRVVISIQDLRTEGTIDSLQLYDGVINPTITRKRPIVTLGGDIEFLGNTTFQSNGTTLTLVFRTDLSVVYRGWNLTFYSEPLPASATTAPTAAPLTCPPTPPCICPTTKWYIQPTTQMTTRRRTTQRATTEKSVSAAAVKSEPQVQSASRRFSGLPFGIGVIVGILLSTLVLAGLVVLRKMGYCTGLPDLPAVRFKKEPQHTFFSNEAYQPYAESNGQPTIT